MSFSTTSTPGGKSLGTQDNSRVFTPPEPKQASMTMTLIPVLAERGRGAATIVTTGAAHLYGAKSFQKGSPYFTHANKLLVENSALGVPSLVKRIIPEGANKALLRLSLELIPTDIPVYERNSDGTIKRTVDQITGTSTPVTSGTIQGTRIVPHIGVGGYFGDAQKFAQGNIVDDYRDGSLSVAGKFLGEITRGDGSKEHPKSRLIPIADFYLDSEGGYGNNMGLRLSVPTTVQADPADITNITSNKAFPVRLTVMERETKNSTPNPVRKLAGDFTQDLFLKTRATDFSTGNSVSLAKKFVSNYYRKESATDVPLWPPFGNVHVYEKNINEIQQILSEGYEYTDANGNDIAIAGEASYDDEAMDYGRTEAYGFSDSNNYGLLNFLTAKDFNNVPYFASTSADAVAFGGIAIDESATHYATGGSDGLWFFADGTPAEVVNLKVFDDKVRNFLTNFGYGEDKLKDILRFPFTNFIDTGYSIDTKLAASSLLLNRPDVVLIMGAKQVCELGASVNDVGPVYRDGNTNATATISADLIDTWQYQGDMSAEDELAMAVKLRSHFSLYPESTFFGTPILRVMVFGSDGLVPDETLDYRLPGSYDRGLAINAFTQVTRWEPASDFTENDNRKPRYLTEMTYHWREEAGYDKVWDAGMNFLRSHDVNDNFWPAVQTIYPYKDSILSSGKFALIAAHCHYVGMVVWASISGENKTDLQFKQDLEDGANAELAGRFPEGIMVIPVANLTDADKARGYSGELKFHIGLGSMRTKLTYSVHGYTLDQLTALQGTLATGSPV